MIVRVASPHYEIAPSLLAILLVKVLLPMVMLPENSFSMPPPKLAMLFWKNAWVSVRFALLSMPPPMPLAVLFVNVLLLMESLAEPTFSMPPPLSLVALLPLTVLPLTVSVPVLKMPPPSSATLLEMMQLFRARLPEL